MSQTGGGGSAARILIADDDPSILGMLEARLEKAGYQVATAPDGVQALARAQELRPQLILLDVMMPRMSGWEVARAIRNDDDPELAGTKILVLTAIGADLSEMTSPLYQVDAHMDKPFDFTELDATIARLLAA